MPLNWIESAPGVWRAKLGTPTGPTPLDVVNAVPRTEGLQALGPVAFPDVAHSLEIEPVGSRTVLRLPLAPAEAIYGLGLQFFKVNHRGRTRVLRVNSDPRQDTGESHAPVPFYVSSAGYGLLVNTARIVTLCCGSNVRAGSVAAEELRDRGRDTDWQPTLPSSMLEIVLPEPDAELILFAGASTLEVVRRYNLYCGGGVLPPRWGLGFWHRVPTQFTDKEVQAEAQEFRTRGYPCDVIGLEPGWHSKSYPCSYEWGADRFPHPAQFVGEMRQNGFQINLWEHGYVSPVAKIHAALEPYGGSHTAFGGLVPDFTLPEARAILQRQHTENHLEIGVSGYKIDECDGSELTGASWMFPAHSTFPSGLDGEQMRQIFGLLLQELTTEMFRKQDRRTYGLVRASNAGASSLPYVLYSDLYDHREFVRALINSSFSGLLWTPEIRSARTAEEWVRRMQVVCFSPLAMLNAWSDGTKPWSFPDVEPIIRKYLELRMRLIPYLYSAFARYYFDGTPPFRAMALETAPVATAPGSGEGFAVAAYDTGAQGECDDQYLMGDSLLVAPVFAGQQWRDVLLPPGTWYDFESGARYEGGKTHRVFPALETLPVFVRDGGIVPLMPALPHAPRAGESVPLEVRHYGTASGEFQLFDDDGETYGFERGDYRWRTLAVNRSADGTYVGTITGVEPGWNSSYSTITWRTGIGGDSSAS